MRDVGVSVRLDTPIAGIRVENGAVSGADLEGGEFLPVRRIIVAVGGSSFPATGTTGDGWRWMTAAGHTLVPLRAALAPLYLDPTPPAEWSGVALRDCVLRARRRNPDGSAGKERMKWARRYALDAQRRQRPDRARRLP